MRRTVTGTRLSGNLIEYAAGSTAASGPVRIFNVFVVLLLRLNILIFCTYGAGCWE